MSPALPIAKLGALLIRTVAKPIAKGLHDYAKDSHSLRVVCEAIGQTQHKVIYTVHVKGLYFNKKNAPKKYKIKDLSPEVALKNGADFLGEFFLFTLAAGIVVREYNVSQEKSAAAKEKIELEQQKKENELSHRLHAIEMRLEKLESGQKAQMDKMLVEIEKLRTNQKLEPNSWFKMW